MADRTEKPKDHHRDPQLEDQTVGQRLGARDPKRFLVGAPIGGKERRRRPYTLLHEGEREREKKKKRGSAPEIGDAEGI